MAFFPREQCAANIDRTKPTDSQTDRQQKNLSEYVWNDIVLGVHVCLPVTRTHSDAAEQFRVRIT